MSFLIAGSFCIAKFGAWANKILHIRNHMRVPQFLKSSNFRPVLNHAGQSTDPYNIDKSRLSSGVHYKVFVNRAVARSSQLVSPGLILSNM